MYIETEQKIIQVGSSDGVTLSKKDLSKLGVKRGDMIKVRFEPVSGQAKHEKLMQEYDAFIKEYGETLEILADK